MILALKTAGLKTQAWLFTSLDAVEPTGHLEWESGRDLAEQFLSWLTDFAAAHNSALDQLDGIAIYSGPGSFTSLRIGHAVANALADSLSIPIIGAAGDDWLAVAQKSLRGARPSRPALPEYGADAHITRPKS